MSAIMNMRTTTPVNTFIGPGSSRMVGMLSEKVGAKTAFVVCDAGVKAAGLVDGILESLQEKNISAQVFDGVVADAPDTVVDQAADLCRSAGCQVVIGVGGGSSLDTAKSIAMLQNNPGKVSEYATNPKKPRVKGAKLILIPTTAGTGSETTTGAVVAVSPMGIKCGFTGPDLLPDFTLVDPLLTLGLPHSQTAATAMDAFAHCVESMLTGISNPVCDVLALEGIRLITNTSARSWKTARTWRPARTLCSPPIWAVCPSTTAAAASATPSPTPSVPNITCPTGFFAVSPCPWWWNTLRNSIPKKSARLRMQ